MNENNDLTRLKYEYQQRNDRLLDCDQYQYSYFNKSNLFTIQSRQRELLSILRKYGFYPLTEKTVLDLGCGGGGILTDLLAYGGTPTRLHGTDLIIERVANAHARLTHLPLSCSDGQNLPYIDQAYDLILQFTVFSSILDDDIKFNISREILRVLRTGGVIIWYDFWLNPTNPHTRGIKPAEIRTLFPNCVFEFHRITLAPPIARRIVPISWTLAYMLEKLKLFNSHYLVAIRPN